jgi:hypothetical protein
LIFKNKTPTQNIKHSKQMKTVFLILFHNQPSSLLSSQKSQGYLLTSAAEPPVGEERLG